MPRKAPRAKICRGAPRGGTNAEERKKIALPPPNPPRTSPTPSERGVFDPA